MAKCEICGKGQVSGNNVSHSNRKTKRSFKVNVQKVFVHLLRNVHLSGRTSKEE